MNFKRTYIPTRTERTGEKTVARNCLKEGKYGCLVFTWLVQGGHTPGQQQRKLTANLLHTVEPSKGTKLAVQSLTVVWVWSGQGKLRTSQIPKSFLQFQTQSMVQVRGISEHMTCECCILTFQPFSCHSAPKFLTASLLLFRQEIVKFLWEI